MIDLKKNIDTPDFLTSLRYSFQNCINPEKRNKKECKLGRVHYTDTRDFNKKHLLYWNAVNTEDENDILFLTRDDYTKKMLILFSRGIEETKRFFLDLYYREIYKLKKKKKVIYIV